MMRLSVNNSGSSPQASSSGVSSAATSASLPSSSSHLSAGESRFNFPPPLSRFAATGGPKVSASSSGGLASKYSAKMPLRLPNASLSLFQALRRQGHIDSLGSRDSLSSPCTSREESEDLQGSPPFGLESDRLSNALCRSVLHSSSASRADVSPQILKKTQNRLKLRQLRFFGGSSGSTDKSTSSFGSSGGQPAVSWHLPQATVEEAETGITYSLDYDEMEGDCSPSLSRLKKLRARQQTSADQPIWRPMGPCQWQSTNGLELTLAGRRFEYTTEVERHCLQKVAFSRLLKANLGCPISRPKDSGPTKYKRLKYVKRKAHTVNVIESAKEKGESRKEKKDSPSSARNLVFGIPISECIENDLKQQSAKASSTSLPEEPPQNRCKSLDLDEMDNLRVSQHQRSPMRLSAESSKSSLSSLPSSSESGIILNNIDSSKNSLFTHESIEELPLARKEDTVARSAIISEKPKPANKHYASSIENLLTEFSAQSSPGYISSRSTDSTLVQQQSSSQSLDSCEPHSLVVPKIVQNCCQYLQERGLSTIGLFRVNASVKRCRQMRLHIDSGQELTFIEEDSDVYPHDVANILKEYFKELPNPLLTKELYAAFIATAKLPENRKIDTLRNLIALLPTANIDTLIVLLKFLQQVVGHSYDTISDNGVLISGNKMNAHNLATIFGPNVLRPGSTKQMSLLDTDSVISIIETMIENCDSIITIPSELQHILYCNMLEMDPEALDVLLFRLYDKKKRELENPVEQDECQTTIYYNTREEVFPTERTIQPDGSTVITTRQRSTHKITYKFRRDTGSVVESRTLDAAFPPLRPLGDNFASDITLFADDDCGDRQDACEPLGLIDPSKLRHNRSPLSKFGGLWNNYGKPKDQTKDLVSL